jgi:DNA-binding MarR family transcriptional regulator
LRTGVRIYNEVNSKMAGIELCDASLGPMYQQLLAEFPDASPEAVEASLKFMRIGANQHVRMDALFDQHGLTSGRFALLMILRHEPLRELSCSELAKRAQVTRATMTQFIDSLEKEQFIKRVDDPSDRRATLIQLTPKAETVLKKIMPEHLRRLAEVTSMLSRAELKELFRLMSKLVRE